MLNNFVLNKNVNAVFGDMSVLPQNTRRLNASDYSPLNSVVAAISLVHFAIKSNKYRSKTKFCFSDNCQPSV